MGILLNVVNKNIGHPSIDLRHCVNRNQRHLSCSACAEICPKRVYDREQKEPPKWDECQNCGLCVSACHARCIAPSPANAKRHLLLAEKKDAALLSCLRSSFGAGHKEECLALIPWEFMAYLALGEGLVLDLSACGECEHGECIALLEEQLTALRRFLGEEAFEKSVTLAFDEVPVVKENGIGRRDFFKVIARGGRQAGALVINDAVGGTVDAMIYRRMLAQRVRELSAQDASFACGMQIPWPDEKTCYGCGICGLLCPNGAIEIGEEEGGKRHIYITPMKCTSCGVCAAVCREGCIHELSAVRVHSLDRTILCEVESASCERCGRAISPKKSEKLCTACKYIKRK